MWIIYYLNTQTKGIYINFEAARSSKEGGRPRNIFIVATKTRSMVKETYLAFKGRPSVLRMMATESTEGSKG